MTAVRIDGLAEFRRALARIDPALAKGVREALKDSAQIVAYEVQRRAPVRTGILRQSVRAFASGNRAGVRVVARRPSPRYPTGYSYPRRIEYRGQPFVRPALAAKREEVVRRLNHALDDVAEIWEG